MRYLTHILIMALVIAPLWAPAEAMTNGPPTASAPCLNEMDYPLLTSAPAAPSIVDNGAAKLTSNYTLLTTDKSARWANSLTGSTAWPTSTLRQNNGDNIDAANGHLLGRSETGVRSTPTQVGMSKDDDISKNDIGGIKSGDNDVRRR